MPKHPVQKAYDQLESYIEDQGDGGKARSDSAQKNLDYLLGKVNEMVTQVEDHRTKLSNQAQGIKDRDDKIAKLEKLTESDKEPQNGSGKATMPSTPGKQLRKVVSKKQGKSR